jgi:hypothetical protein
MSRVSIRGVVWGDGDPRAGRRYDEWRRAHQGKYRFTTRRHAWWAIACMCWRRKRFDVHLTPYTCRWTNDPAADRRTGVPHLHVGHGKLRWPPIQALWEWHRTLRVMRNKLVVWPVLPATPPVPALAEKEIQCLSAGAALPPGNSNLGGNEHEDDHDYVHMGEHPRD